MSSRMEDFGFWLSRTFATTQNRKDAWPHVPGKYFVHDKKAPVAVTTLGSVAFASEVLASKPDGLCIVGKVETENIGIEKIIRNIIANPSIRFLLMVGKEPPKHLTGATFSALFANGIDNRKRIIKSPGMRPVLPNLEQTEVDQFVKQVELVDMIGNMDIPSIGKKIQELAAKSPGIFAASAIISREDTQHVPVVNAQFHDPNKIKLDKAGYFVIHIADSEILVEHYSYKEELLRIIKGGNARDLYLTLIDNNWVSHLDHACYLGKELLKAEQSIENRSEYLQEGA